MTISAAEFGWRLCDLRSTDGLDNPRIAMTRGETYEVSHGGDWEGMCEPGRHPSDQEYLAALPPVEHGEGKLVYFGDAVYEANHQGAALSFDRGRLLEYELGDGWRAVVFVSNRRWVEFQARAATPEERPAPEAKISSGV
jgi:hypothetical protein